MNVAIIPARGGSKRIPRKNIKEFCGKPIIAYSIEVALSSGLFDRVIVSTDDDEIAAVAKKYGAEVPFMRPKELSDDHTGTTAVIAHAIQWLTNNNLLIDNVCCIYATAPLIKKEYLIKGYENITGGHFNMSFSAVPFKFPIQRALRINSSGKTEPIDPLKIKSRSQDLESTFHDAGQFYWAKSHFFSDQYSFFSSLSCPIILPRYLAQDIDDEEDWLVAQSLFNTFIKDRHSMK